MSNDHDTSNNPNIHNNNKKNDLPILAHIAKKSLPIKDKTSNQLPGDLNILLSSNTSKSSTTTLSKNNTSTKQHDEIYFNCIKYRCINTLYYDSRNITNIRGALVDRGANGELVGDDVRVISKTSRAVNVQI